MMDGDLNNMKYDITEEHYQQIVNEEFVSMMREQYGNSVLEEGFWDKLKGGGKKIAKAYMDIFKAYGEVIEDLLGLKPEDPQAPEVPEPEELAQDLAAGDTEEAAAAVDDMEAALNQAKQKAANNPEAMKKVDAVLQQVDAVDGALEKQDGGEGGKSEDSEALLNMIDTIIDDWDAIQGKTKDGNLKKAMDYIEKIALAELKKLRRKNNG